jgi:hypothetical protein
LATVRLAYQLNVLSIFNLLLASAFVGDHILHEYDVREKALKAAGIPTHDGLLKP